MKKNILLICFTGLVSVLFSQNYDSYFTGNSNDVATSPQGGICLMGGATEEDEAMIWFLNRADGGDVLVLRASGSDGYNNYFFSQLGVTVNSVETIVFNNASASNEAYVQQKVAQAEAIWFAGGDQWDYVSYWRNTAIDSLINEGITQRNIVIGGTSAGMAIQGGYYFSAENGTVTSPTALSNPFDANVTADSTSFLQNNVLENVITDTHYDNPDRKGRHVTFLARIWEDYGVAGKGIACDEYTAVCIDENNIAHVYGQHPNFDDNAYFLQVNCELADASPENCTLGNALTWDHSGTAVKVYAVKGTLAGTNTFDLNDWESGTGGEWQHWSVINGTLNETVGTQPDCGSLTVEENTLLGEIEVYPNPASTSVTIDIPTVDQFDIKILSADGRVVYSQEQCKYTIELNTQHFDEGIYFVELLLIDGSSRSAQFVLSH